MVIYVINDVIDTCKSLHGESGHRIGSETWIEEIVPINQLILEESSVSNGILNLIPGDHRICIAFFTREAFTQNSGVLALG